MLEAPQTERVRLRRGPAKGRYDRAAVHRVLDNGLIAHVAFLDADGPVCVPMLYARVGDIVYIHGSVGSRAIRCLSTRASACVTVTNLRGLVLARSAFEHSAKKSPFCVRAEPKPGSKFRTGSEYSVARNDRS